MSRLPALGLLALLAGCGVAETAWVHDPLRSPFIGGNVVDMISTVGTPDKYTRVMTDNGTDRLLVQWNFSNSDTALSVTVPLLASVQVGGSGKCSLVATVERQGGTVLDTNVVQAHTDGLEPDTAACGPLLHRALVDPSRTGLPRSFDAFTLADPGSNTNTNTASVAAPPHPGH